MDFTKKKKIVIHWFLNELTPPEKASFLSDLSDVLSKSQKIMLLRDDFLHLDFLKALPRRVSTLILLYLDPRSLSRCARVCWFWKTMAETDEIWKSKCKLQGWTVKVPVTDPYSNVSWKKVYITNVANIRTQSMIGSVQSHLKSAAGTADRLHLSTGANSKPEIFSETNEENDGTANNSDDTWQDFINSSRGKQQLESNRSNRRNPSIQLIGNDQVADRFSDAAKIGNFELFPRSATSTALVKHNMSTNKWQPHQPWRAANRKPADIRRYNYLDNEDQIIAARAKRHDQVLRRSVVSAGSRQTNPSSESVSFANQEVRQRTALKSTTDVPKDKSNSGLVKKSLVVVESLPPWLNTSHVASADVVSTRK